MKKIVAIGLMFSGILFHCNVFSQKVTPKQQDGKFYFQVANVYFEVDPSFGGRISSFKIDNHEILYLEKTSSTSWGSTFWQSPQTWSWPPSTKLDSDPYSGGIAGDSVSLLSLKETKYNLQFRKTFHADLNDTSVTMNYSIKNTGTTTKSYAPWEITRVPVGGIIFYPDSGGVTGVLAPKFSKIGEIMWLNYSGAKFSSSTIKSFGNCKEGWSAWVSTDSAIFIKKFNNIQSNEAAPNENEIEDYYDGPTTYYEIENQGAYKSLAGGDSLNWQMKWYLRKLPDTMQIELGSTSLVDFARKIIKPKSDTATQITSANSEKSSIFPNPTKNSININLRSQYANFILADMSGKAVYNSKLKNGVNTVLLNSITPGIYFYQLKTEDHISSGKLVIIR